MGEMNGEGQIEVLENDIRTLRKQLQEKVQQLKTLKKHFQTECLLHWYKRHTIRWCVY